jgi:hypothetical protein
MKQKIRFCFGHSVLSLACPKVINFQFFHKIRYTLTDTPIDEHQPRRSFNAVAVAVAVAIAIAISLHKSSVFFPFPLPSSSFPQAAFASCPRAQHRKRSPAAQGSSQSPSSLSRVFLVAIFTAFTASWFRFVLALLAVPYTSYSRPFCHAIARCHRYSFLFRTVLQCIFQYSFRSELSCLPVRYVFHSQFR